jgi:uncharacterized protein YciI
MERLGKKYMFLTVSLLVAGFVAAQTQVPEMLQPYIPKNLKPYYLDILTRNEKPSAALSEAEHGALMVKHLAYIRSQVEAGKIMLVGPVTEDKHIAGIAVIQATSPEEAQRIASGDPMVQAGQMSVEVHGIMLVDLSSIRFDYASVK